MSSPPQHPTAWARTDVPEGMGIGTLLPEPDGFRLEAGETVFAREERFLTRFTVWTDLAWATTRVHAEVLSAAGTETVTLQAQGGHWSDGKGGELRELVGCLDVDIAATPLTNTLPIRRLGLRPGEHRDIAVVWIDIPSLRIRRVRQRYTRHHAENGLELYTYRDPLHGEYRISVDGDGVVVDYERFVRRWSPDP
ncbi:MULTISPECIES: putative glycolipid-binding domain-containing protein [Nocardiopsis]|uniref:Glycolipid-binding domain-containing protein n=2 Tax=Nocardiopsis alba TaxID=53437 RepID=A0A7K2IT38_9ACTN|nr:MULTISPECIES: putative glycolipid-binding domain-containing protein [Nocardiopsis]MEC3893540.1 putative glycolipid-binding domain-containing protein [Nocardiopsis sp. LDBS1602]MYR33139.1 glycolipid-binding family protein [Nocardiopsis alba]